MAWIRQMAEENGARYVDFYDLYAQPEFAGYFRDMDHLNRIGAPLFTERVKSACFGRIDGIEQERPCSSARPPGARLSCRRGSAEAIQSTT